MKSPRLLIPIIFLLAIAWFLRPLFHGVIMAFIASPLRLVLIAVLFITAWQIKKHIGPLKFISTGPNDFTIQAPHRKPIGIGVSILVLIAILFGLSLEKDIRYAITAQNIPFEDRANLPEISPVRLMPKSVAARYASDTFQNPQERLGDSQIVLLNDKLVRVFPRTPDGNILYFVNKLSGFVTVEVDTLERKVTSENQRFEIAEGIGIFDNIHYRLPLHNYFATYSREPIYLKDDSGRWITVVPYITYKGFPFTVPQWGGVVVVQSDGSMKTYTPEEAQQVSYLRDNRIHPKELATYYADAFAYKGGILNKWFLHKNETQVVSLPNDEKVIHAATKDGFKQIIVAEPYGRSFGIYKIFLIDASTGKREVISYSQDSQLTGPVAAADYIKKEFPTYDWTAFSLSEPRPVLIGGTLHWLLSIIPNDSAGIASTVLLNASTNKVINLVSQEQVTAVLAGQEAPQTTPPVPTTNPTDAIKQKIQEIEKQLNELKQLVQ